VEECRFYVEVLYVPVKDSRNVQEHAERLETSRGGSRLVVVGWVTLCNTFRNIAHFVSRYVASIVSFALTDQFPFKGTRGTSERGTKTKTFKSVRLLSSSQAPATQYSCSGEATAVCYDNLCAWAHFCVYAFSCSSPLIIAAQSLPTRQASLLPPARAPTPGLNRTDKRLSGHPT
jgi:hypothetical protein